MQHAHSSPPIGRRRLVLQDLQLGRVTFDLLVDGVRERAVVVQVDTHGRPQFPLLRSDATESLGSDDADREVRIRAHEELVRLRADRRRKTAS